MTDLGKVLVVLGVVITAVGLLVWSGLAKSWFGWMGRLPGDVRITRDNFGFYFPVVTCLLVSVIVTLLLTVISWLFRK